MKKLTGIIVGAVLIACGVIYALGEFGIADISVSLDGWWTLFIIIPCLNGIFTSKDKAGSAIGLAFGIMLLMAAQGVFEYDVIWKIVVPVILAGVGIKLIVKSVYSPKDDRSTSFGKNESESSEKEHIAAFNEKSFDSSGEALTAAKVGAVFGGTKCNLTNAKLEDGCNINLMCIFGGAEIFMPENVNIKINTFCLFGGISDKRAVKASDSGSITVNINGFCIFGGADIK